VIAVQSASRECPSREVAGRIPRHKRSHHHERFNPVLPHLVKTFKLSRDPHFTEKVEDIVGLYVNPPDKALMRSVDEKSQIQALDRIQPGCR